MEKSVASGDGDRTAGSYADHEPLDELEDAAMAVLDKARAQTLRN